MGYPESTMRRRGGRGPVAGLLKPVWMLAAALMAADCDHAPTADNGSRDRVDAPGVLLPNGIHVNRDHFRVYLFIGHSNMAGAATSDTTAHDRAWNFYLPEEVDRFEPYTWVPARGALHLWQPFHPGGGPAVHFLKRMAERHPRFYFGSIQNAHFAASVAKDYRPDGPLFGEMVSAFEKISGSVRLDGMVCMLGIGDAILPDSFPASNFALWIRDMVTAFRSELNSPTMPFFIGGLEKEGENFQFWPQGPEIDRQIRLIPELLGNAYVIPTEGIPYHDGHHFTFEGHGIWVNRLLGAMDSIALHPPALSDGTPPSPPSDLLLKYVGDGFFRIGWSPGNDLESHVAGYRLVVEPNGLRADIPPSRSDFEVSPLDAGVAYRVEMQSVDAYGNFSEVEALTLAPSDLVVPNRVQNLAVKSIGAETVVLAWDSLSGAEGPVSYAVYLDGNPVMQTVGTEAEVTGLAPAATYSFFVVASDSRGRSGASGSVEASTYEVYFVESFPLKINCGGLGLLGFEADKAWESNFDFGYKGESVWKTGRELARFLGEPEYGGLPEEVATTALQSLGFEYRFRLKPASYEFRFHFCDLWKEKAGQRRFEIEINGVGMADSLLDPVGMAGGGRAFTLADTLWWMGGVVSIQFRAREGWTLVNGLEIREIPAIEVLSPMAGRRFGIGDTIIIRWTADRHRVDNVVVNLSVDGGNRVFPIAPFSISYEDDSWGRYEWVVTEFVGRASTLGDSCRIVVADYNGLYASGSPGYFSIEK